MIDNSEIESVMEALESCEDEEIAAQLLKEFNDRSREWGRLMLNLDPGLGHEEWKNQCEQARHRLDSIIEKIMKLNS